MKLPIKQFQYALVDKDYNFQYVDNGVVKKQPYLSFMRTPFHPFLPQHPVEWKAFQIAFEMNSKYWLSKRNYSLPLTFVGDGATIIRDRMNFGKGYSEELYLLLLRYNSNTGAYDRECKLQIDFTQYSNDPVRGVKVNAIEGGVLTYLNSRDTNTYELICDETNPDIIQVFDDGITLEDVFNYELLGDSDIAVTAGESIDQLTLATVFLNNTGENVGAVHGNQILDDSDLPGYYASSSNYIFYSIFGATNMRISGSIKVSPFVYPADQEFGLKWYTSLGNSGVILPIAVQPMNRVINFDTGYTINLSPDEKLFFVLYTTGGDFSVTINATDFALGFRSRNQSSQFYALRPLDAWKQLVLLMTDGKYTGDSVWLAAHNNICVTCGDAIRNTDRTVVANYKMAMSLEDFFTSYSSIYNLGIKAVSDVLYIEPKSELFKPDTQIFDLGEVNDLTEDCATEYLANKFICGYPDQNYDSTSASVSGGKYETNSIQEWNLPTAAVNKELNVASKFRGDSRGIEAIRGGLLNKDTTDNDGDKEVFMVNVSDSIISEEFQAVKQDEESYTGAHFINFDFYFGTNFDWNDVAHTQIVFTGNNQKGDINVYMFIDYGGKTIIAALYKNGIGIGTYTGNDTSGGVNLISITVLGVTLTTGDVLSVQIIPFETPTGWTAKSVVLHVDFTLSSLTLTRATYDSISGVIDNTVYNIEEMTPHRQLQAWMPYIASLFYQQPTDSVTLLTAKKSIALITTLAGVTISEAQAEVIGNYISRALFIPRIFKFKTKIPVTFEVLSQMGTGYIQLSFNGTIMYGLPFGKLISKPGTNEAQEWELLAAPNNLLSDFLKLSTFGITIIEQDNLMFISDYNPVQWVKYAYSLQSKYHHLDMYDDWSYNRFNRYYSKPVYFQKWQTSDTVKMQFLVSGITGGLDLFVYDCAGEEYFTTALTPTANTAVTSTFVLYQGSISLATYAPNRYLFVVRTAGGQNLLVSEWQDVKVNHPATYLAEYSSTYNKFNMFFNSIGQMQFRFEGIFGIPDEDSDFYEFVDEPGNIELLNAIPFERQRLSIGNPYGVPDWVGKKINLITLLNGLLIEGKAFTRNLDAKLEATFRDGYKYNKYALELRPAYNLVGLEVIAEEEAVDEDVTSFMLNQQAIGMNGEATLDVEITNT